MCPIRHDAGARGSTAAGRGDHELDMVGIGFGPSNLALAIAVKEHNESGAGPALRTAFLERQPRFGWHLGMLIDGATMQVSFLKDLVTMRNPMSSLSFVNYLHERGRLAGFINQKTFFPTRVEFHDYLEWSAGHVPELVTYDREVTRVRPVRDDTGTVVSFDVESRHASTHADGEVLRARNIVVGSGMTPRVPRDVVLSDRVWHSSQLQDNFGSLTGTSPRSVAVVGSGQSAAEVAAFLHDNLPDAEIYCVMQRYGYSPADDTPFANRVFDPEAVDDFYAAKPEIRERIIGYHANTNYAVVDEELITDLYKRVYQESVAGRPRLIMRTLR
jgi:L-ornithine N5-monooxygenase